MRASRWYGRWASLVVVAVAVATTSRAEANPTAPSVCSSPCPDGQTCVGSTCVGARPPQPEPPPPEAGVAYSPPPGIQAPATRGGQKRGFLALPYFGMHSYQHSRAATYDPGVRLGTFVGGRFNDTTSLNAEVTFDYSNVGGVPAPLAFREWVLDFVISPLFRVPAGSLELVLGPRAGLFVSDTSMTVNDRKWGFVLGVNAGLFMPVSPTTSFGVLLSFGSKRAMNDCAAIAGDFVSCGVAGTSIGYANVFGLAGAAMF